MKKVLLLIAAALLLAVLFGSCSSVTDKTGPDIPEETTQTEVPETEAPKETEKPVETEAPKATEAPSHVHTWGEWTVVVEPTCYSQGVRERVCLLDVTHVERELMDIVDHVYVTREDIAPTCVARGQHGGTQCKYCGKTRRQSKDVPPTGIHDYEETLVEEPGYMKEGLATCTCKVCGYSYNKKIGMLTFNPDDVWDGTVADGYASGDGSKENPYIIENAAQLAYLAEHDQDETKGKYYKLAKDIIVNDLRGWENWDLDNGPANRMTPIEFFYGSFDGCGHSIRGLYCSMSGNRTATGNHYGSRGLFYSIGLGSELRNLNVSESFMVADGGIVNSVVGTYDSHILISGCSFSGKIIGAICGGIVGRVSVGLAHNGGEPYTYGYVTIENCINNGNIMSYETEEKNTHNYCTGGIAGDCVCLFGYCRIENCVNNGTINGANKTGGIVGEVATRDYPNSERSVLISSCKNFGDVTSKKSADGIVGNIWIYDETAPQFEDCFNYGNVSENVK